jgi:hypothetical protein
LNILKLVILISTTYPIAASAQLKLANRQVAELVVIKDCKPSAGVEKADVEMGVTFGISKASLPRHTPSSNSILYSVSNNAFAYHPRHYGVFCRIESSIEKKSGISPRFRLGSSAYVDMLEGKQ